MDRDDMFEGAAELAGYFLAHAVCCIEHGDILVPLVGHERVATEDGERAFALLRFEAVEQVAAIRNAEQWLESAQHDLARAVLIHDGFVTWAGVRRDALFSRAIDFRRPRRSLEVVIPYRHARDAGGFAIHRPKLLNAVGLPDDVGPVIKALYRGVDAHEQGSKVWARHLDQSV
jgi:hypothetical protein